MWEMIESARLGWQTYTDVGKLSALVIAAMIYLVIAAGIKGPKGRLMSYAGVMTVVCICPVTAAILMIYQTRFYDYQWIWSMVPVTAVIALGGTVFWTEQCKPGKGWRTILRNAIVTCASVVVLLLCGGLGEGSVDVAKAEAERSHAQSVLDEVQQVCGEDVCLWAPAQIMEYARLDGDMKLLYGRNMWDAALNAYSYDTYSEEQQELYQWMEYLDDWEIDISVEEAEDFVQRGFENGADCVLLPTEMSDWLKEPESEDLLLERLGSDSNREVIVLEGYYLLKLR